MTAMKTAVLDSGFAGASRQTIPLVLAPARKPRRIVVPFSLSKPELEAPDARIQVLKPIVSEWVEFGFAMVLLASAFSLILLSVAAAGNM